MTVVKRLLVALAALLPVVSEELPPLHRAALNGDYQRVKALVAPIVQSPHVDERAGRMNRTALHFAIGQGDVAVAKYLLFAGASPRAIDAQNMTALHLAALKGYVATLAVLSKAGADLDARSAHGMTPLHLATAQGHRRFVEALLHAGATFGLRNSAGATALDLADDVEVRLTLHGSSPAAAAKRPLDCEGNHVCIEGSLTELSAEMERLEASAGFDSNPALQRQHGALFIAKKRQLAAVLMVRIRQITAIEDYDEDEVLMRNLKALRKAYREHQEDIVPSGVRKDKPLHQRSKHQYQEQEQQQRRATQDELRQELR